MSGFRRGVRLGIDVGRARVGVARCDPDGLLATPVETVPRDEDAVTRVVALADEHSAFELLVGLPLNLRGEDTASTTDAREFAAALAAASGRSVRLVDERLSQELVDRFVAAGAIQVYVGWGVDLRGPRKVVVKLTHHDDHLHVRIR